MDENFRSVIIKTIFETINWWCRHNHTTHSGIKSKTMKMFWSLY